MAEMRMKVYDKAPEADAVVLYEKGEYIFKLVENRIVLYKTVHRKTKVFNAKRFEDSEVSIKLYKGEKSAEKLIYLKGMTYTGLDKTPVKSTNIFDNDATSRYKEVTFAFPKVQDGSIVEYMYRIETGFFFNFGDWNFQGKYPKMYSEFVSEVPYNFVYNKILLGNQKLDINQAFDQASCIPAPNRRYTDADCEYNLYAMYDVPAYSDEPYMLSVDNYISKLRHELIEFKRFEGTTVKYARSWEDVDKEFLKDKEVGKQLNNQKLFSSSMPQEIFAITDDLQRAKAVYSYIRDHYFWNNEYRIYSDVNVKEAYEAKTGNNSDINLSLINALNAAGIPAKIALISTRDYGLPTLAYPVYSEYDFILAHIIIEGKPVFLDATLKEAPFGVLPFRDLNIYARVMDFENGSYWETINPPANNTFTGRITAAVDKDGNISSEVSKSYTGEIALDKRLFASETQVDDYPTVFVPPNNNQELTGFTLNNLDKPEELLQAEYTATGQLEKLNDQYLLNPFELAPLFDTNPFESPKRDYPIDFGFPRNYTLLIAYTIAPELKIVALPKNRQELLPDNSGSFTCNYSQKDNQVYIRLQFKLIGFQFEPDKAADLKSFFGSLLKAQQELIVLEQAN